MKLYSMTGACSTSVHIVLEWIGQPYEYLAVAREDLKKEPFISVNPVGSVPAFVDSELTLTQTTAILQYLAEKYPDSNLLGEDIQQKAQTRMWLGMINADIHRNFALIFGHRNYVDQESCIEQLKAGAIKQLHRYFAVIDKQLKGKDYLTGTRSIADPYLFVVAGWARRLEVDISEHKEVIRFYNQMKEDPGVKAAFEQQKQQG